MSSVRRPRSSGFSVKSRTARVVSLEDLDETSSMVSASSASPKPANVGEHGSFDRVSPVKSSISKLDAISPLSAKTVSTASSGTSGTWFEPPGVVESSDSSFTFDDPIFSDDKSMESSLASGKKTESLYRSDAQKIPASNHDSPASTSTKSRKSRQEQEDRTELEKRNVELSQNVADLMKIIQAMQQQQESQLDALNSYEKLVSDLERNRELQEIKILDLERTAEKLMAASDDDLSVPPLVESEDTVLASALEDNNEIEEEACDQTKEEESVTESMDSPKAKYSKMIDRAARSDKFFSVGTGRAMESMLNPVATFEDDTLQPRVLSAEDPSNIVVEDKSSEGEVDNNLTSPSNTTPNDSEKIPDVTETAPPSAPSNSSGSPKRKKKKSLRSRKGKPIVVERKVSKDPLWA